MIMALFVLRKLILQTCMRSHPVWLEVCFFGRSLILLPYFMCANSEGSGETARMRRLAWAFAGRLYDKYHNLMSWLNWCSDRRQFNKQLSLSKSHSRIMHFFFIFRKKNRPTYRPIIYTSESQVANKEFLRVVQEIPTKPQPKRFFGLIFTRSSMPIKGLNWPWFGIKDRTEAPHDKTNKWLCA